MTPDPRTSDVETLIAQAGWMPRLARSLVRDPDAADDIAQDAWVVALENAPERTEPAAVRGWLTTILRRLAIRRAQREEDRRHHERSAARAGASTTPVDEVERMQLQRALADAVLALAEPYRTAVILRYLDGLEYGAIAARQRVSNAAARKHVSRGLAMLRDRLESEHDEGRHGGLVALLPFARDVDRPRAGSALEVPARHVVERRTWRAVSKASIAGSVIVAGIVVVVLVVGALTPMPSSPSPGDVAKGPRPEVSRSTTAQPLFDPSSAGPRARVVASRTETQGAASLLTGRVVDPSGAPVARAQVEARCDTGRGLSVPDPARARDGKSVGSAVTDHDGTFAIGASAFRAHDLWVRAAGFPATRFAGVLAGAPALIRLGPPARLAGRVIRGTDRSPIIGVSLRGWTTDGAELLVFEGSTDERGCFLFEGLQPARIALEVVPDEEEAPPWIEVDLSSGIVEPIEVVVDPGVVVHGRVVVQGTQVPVPGARVGEGWKLRRATECNAQGRFELRGFARRVPLEVHARADGFAGGSALPRIDADGVVRVEIALEPEAMIRGVLIDESRGPVDGAYVAAVGHRRSKENVPGVDSRSALSVSDGSFLIRGLSRDVRHVLLVRAEGRATIVLGTPARDDAHVIDVGEILLPPAHAIAGTVLDESGKPVQDALVEIRAIEKGGPDLERARRELREMQTDARGRFACADLVAAGWRVRATKDGVTADVGTRTGDATAVVELNLTLDLRLSISGRVVGEGNVPVSRARVWARPGGRQDARFVETDASGRFVLRGFEPGMHELVVLPEDVRGVGRAPVLMRSMRVAAGTEDALIVLPTAGIIRGRVVDAQGKPLRRISVSVPDETGFAHDNETRTDLEGRFELHVLPQSPVDVVAVDPEHDGVQSKAEHVAPGSLDVRITLDRHP